MVLACPVICKSSSPFVTPVGIVLTTGIIVTSMFHSFFQFFGKVYVLVSILVFFDFYSVVQQYGKVHYSAVPLFFSVNYL